MLSIKEKLGTGIVTASVLAAVIGGGAAFADTSIRVNGNGFGSDNRVDFRSDRNTNITQRNDTDIDNNVNIRSNTGRNSSSFNTGGDNRIDTGDIDNRVTIRNEGGINRAVLNSCGNGCNGGARINVSDNGAFSDNRVRVRLNEDTDVRQNNDTDINNRVSLRSNTGDNDTSFNTHRRNRDGRNEIRTGDIDGRVDIRNLGSTNIFSQGR